MDGWMCSEKGGGEEWNDIEETQCRLMIVLLFKRKERTNASFSFFWTKIMKSIVLDHRQNILKTQRVKTKKAAIGQTFSDRIL